MLGAIRDMSVNWSGYDDDLANTECEISLVKVTQRNVLLRPVRFCCGEKKSTSIGWRMQNLQVGGRAARLLALHGGILEVLVHATRAEDLEQQI